MELESSFLGLKNIYCLKVIMKELSGPCFLALKKTVYNFTRMVAVVSTRNWMPELDARTSIESQKYTKTLFD